MRDAMMAEYLSSILIETECLSFQYVINHLTLQIQLYTSRMKVRAHDEFRVFCEEMRRV